MRRLKLVDERDYSAICMRVTARLAERGEEPTEDFLKWGVLALKQFYATKLLGLENPATSLGIDLFVEADVVISPEYMEFCRTVFGGYLHHVESYERQHLLGVTKAFISQHFTVVPDGMFAEFVGHDRPPPICWMELRPFPAAA